MGQRYQFAGTYDFADTSVSLTANHCTLYSEKRQSCILVKSWMGSYASLQLVGMVCAHIFVPLCVCACACEEADMAKSLSALLLLNSAEMWFGPQRARLGSEMMGLVVAVGSINMAEIRP